MKTKNYLVCFQFNRNNDEDSSSLKGHNEPVCKFFPAKIAEYDEKKVTGYKYNANFVFKPCVPSYH